MRNPWRVGAVAPSGRALADLITSDITPGDQPIIELGPGTGTFTRALLARGVPPDRLALIEADPDFARLLQERFPQLRVLVMDAADLGAQGSCFGQERAGAVISGLPLLSMAPTKAAKILWGAFKYQLRADGAFYQFTYMPRCPVPHARLEQMGLEAARLGFALANMPPATVYRIRRRARR